MQDLNPIPQINIWPTVGALAAHHCQLYCIGNNRESELEKYFIENSRFEGRMCIFQYTIDGRGVFEDGAGGCRHVMTAGKAFLAMAPSDTRWWVEKDESWHFLWAHIGGDTALYHAQEILRQYGPVMDLERGSQAVQTLLTLYAEARNSRRLNPYWASSQLYAFLMELYRELEREAEALAIPEGIWRSRQCIEDRFSEPHLCVNELASAAGYSRYHYTRLFSRAFHMSPYDYLLQVRLENAQRYLESTNHSVEQISSLCGFAEAGNFRRALKRRTGLTPSQIRKRSGAPLASRMPQHSKRGRGE